ncbi:DUF493 domain-containing protein [Chlamydiales bacterium]|nr:DUF493 domain-containing protein [Chlamydiales bacterium]
MNQKKEKLAFPCIGPLKVIGPNDPQFIEDVLKHLSKHLGEILEGEWKTKESKEGKYLSLTVSVYFSDREMFDAIHKEVKSVPRVVMVL